LQTFANAKRGAGDVLILPPSKLTAW